VVSSDLTFDEARSARHLWSLATRVGLSITLFYSILVANWIGWIHPTGTPFGR
jgi:hypothetical protein